MALSFLEAKQKGDAISSQTVSVGAKEIHSLMMDRDTLVPDTGARYMCCVALTEGT